MARKTFDELDRLTKAADEKRRKLSGEIDELMKQKGEIHKEAQAAAEAGDVDLYAEKRRAEERIEDAIFVKRTMMDKVITDLSREDVMDAWESFSAGYDRDFEKKLKEYQTLRKNLLGNFMELCFMQNNALKLRERCAELAGETRLNVFKMQMIPDAAIHRYNNINMGNPDAQFFLKTGDASETDLDFFHAVIHLQKPF